MINVRYEQECLKLGELAKYALNKPKNISKKSFETSSLEEIIEKLDEEIIELKFELLNFENYEKTFEELADCAAVLTGLLAWLSAYE